MKNAPANTRDTEKTIITKRRKSTNHFLVNCLTFKQEKPYQPVGGNRAFGLPGAHDGKGMIDQNT